MAKRLGRVIINDKTAQQWAYAARNEGRDTVRLHGRCTSPVVREFTGLQDPAMAHLRRVKAQGATIIRNGVTGLPVWVSFPMRASDPARLWHVDALVPCRKCPQCLRRRAKEWTDRATFEIGRANRTWFCTFTLSPEWQFKTLARARQASEAKAVPWQSLSRDERWTLHCREVYGDFQKYLKRLRKEGADLRYVVVFERHTGGGMAYGMPHLHALIHEPREPVRHKRLVGQWSLGFATAKLVEDAAGSARYVCKYLTKESCNKVRASLKYGLTKG